MEYRTLYTIIEDTARVPWGHVAIGVIAALLFGWGVWRVVKGRVERGPEILFLVFAGAWVAFWNIGILPASWSIYHDHALFSEGLRNGACEVVEGIVQDFHPMPPHGHALESLTVNGVRFEYSEYDNSKPGYNRTASRGGFLRGGMQVRIHYVDRSILQIEIPAAAN